jgi:Histidine kinase-, DNA gyrase B-, and HSP90-like ATPase
MGLAIETSSLWGRLEETPDFRTAILDLRTTAEVLGRRIEGLLPGFTDHSVRHMDALWKVADQVLTRAEVDNLSPAEAFVLGASFYIHDLGMAMGATEVGLRLLRESPTFVAQVSRLQQVQGLSPVDSERLALQSAARELHAKNAPRLVNEKIPGLDRYLIENTEIRSQWSYFIGEVSESHHWSLTDVNSKLGMKGRVPAPAGGEIDLGFVACVLRVIDFAHINFDRASVLDRALRRPMPLSSLVHWQAQERVTGPSRDDQRLRYHAFRPIDDVDAWWLFYDMASGLNDEIVSVHEYLQGRTCSSGRFSLQGVQGVTTPQAFAALVPTDRFEPVDVRLRPHSIDRLIEILGGRSLYGDDNTVPIRELIQNARDAIGLRLIDDAEMGRTGPPPYISVSVSQERGRAYLTVQDNGVGMSRKVLTEYLLGIASEYWKSDDFFAEFPRASTRFRPAGRFGIGFLSVFMIGNEVEIESERRGSSRHQLRLGGAGRRGALMALPSRSEPGTTIRIALNPGIDGTLPNLLEAVRFHAPMLEFDVAVSTPGAGEQVLRAGWWSEGTATEFLQKLVDTMHGARDLSHPHRPDERFYRHRLLGRPSGNFESQWPRKVPEVSTNTFRIAATPESVGVFVCSHGMRVGLIGSESLSGLVEVGPVELNAARSETLGWDQERFRRETLERLLPAIVEEVNALETGGNVPSQFQFLESIGSAYGYKALTESTLPWLSLIEPPGSGMLLRPSEFKERLRTENRILVTLEVGPWSAWARAHARYPDAPSATPVVPVSCEHPNLDTSYDRLSEVVQGPLWEHFRGREARRTEWSGKPILLQAALRLIAEAWSTSPEALASQTLWSRNRRDGGLCGSLTR